MQFVNKKFVIEIVKLSSFFWPVFVFSIALVLIIVAFSSIKDRSIFPNIENYNYYYYTDEANGGNSQVLNYSVTDSLISLKFDLHEGFFSPYVGVGITPKLKGYLNAARYNQVKLSLKGENFEKIGVTLITPSYFSNENTETNETIFNSNISISNQKETHFLDIKQFIIPDWWKEQHNISQISNISPNFRNILNINIGVANSTAIKKEMSLEIYNISFTRNNSKLFLILGMLEGLFILFAFAINYLLIWNRQKSTPITVLYKPLEIDDNIPIKSCFEFINQNFQNSNLCLDQISKETGISYRHITNSIQAEFKCNFKTYLNRIRINESKRILKQTNLNIGEIAFKVGFNNQSHFNRVFKNELKISPSAYREKNKA